MTVKTLHATRAITKLKPNAVTNKILDKGCVAWQIAINPSLQERPKGEINLTYHCAQRRIFMEI